jgi:integrase/recombinase XerD
MSVVTGMAAQAAAFMQGAGYSPGSVGSYRRIWGQFGEYCAMSGVQEPDRETAARFQRSGHGEFIQV